MKKIIKVLSTIVLVVPMTLAVLSVSTTPALAAGSPTQVSASARVRAFKRVKVARPKRVVRAHTHNKEKLVYQIEHPNLVYHKHVS
jgi:hypothetical protein